MPNEEIPRPVREMMTALHCLLNHGEMIHAATVKLCEATGRPMSDTYAASWAAARHSGREALGLAQTMVATSMANRIQEVDKDWDELLNSEQRGDQRKPEWHT
jgi:hypothetical protein